MQFGGTPSSERSMSWVDKARGCVRSAEFNNSVERGHVVAPHELKLVQEDIDRQIVCQSTTALLCIIPLDVWDNISCFLSFSDLQAVCSTCRYLWLFLHSRDYLWKGQLKQFRCDMADSRVDKRLLCTSFLASPKQSAYERLKLEHRLYVLDTRREWYFRDLERPDHVEGIFSYQLTIDDVTDDGDDVWDADVVFLTQIRILRPVLESSLNHSNSVNGIFNDAVERATFTPSEYITLCDNVNRRDFSSTRISARDCTLDEDEFFIFALLQTLRHAKRRPTAQRTQSEGRTSYHRMLRYFRGTLISICRVEAEHILASIQCVPKLLESFVISKDPLHCDPSNLAGRCQARYFIAPELCRFQRVGLFIVDPVRLLVVVGKDRETRDDPRWDEEQVSAAEEGRSAPGSGMNPQNRRRPWLTRRIGE